MKLLLALVVPVAMFAAQEAKKPATPAAKTTATKAQQPPPLTEIPAGAEEVEPGTFRFTDAQGKKWYARKTPFGIARFEDTGEPLSKRASDRDNMDGVTISEKGEALHFERPGPFGIYKWDKKKSELTDSEKAAWERQKNGAAPRQSKSSSKQD